MKTTISSIIAIGAMLCIQQTARSITESPTIQGVTPVVLKTQDFESGEKQMATVPAELLERFLQDLNQRKDWDYACHNGQPGPDAAYLFKWVTQTTSELVARGYYFDPVGQLHRPGVIIPVR